MKIGSVACGADPAVRLAAEREVAADPAVPRVDLAGAWAVGVVPVASILVLADGSLEDVEGPLDGGELDEAPVPLGAKLPKSSSCD